MTSLRNLLFASLAILSLVVFWVPVRTLVHYAVWGDNLYDQYSYTMAIPLISVILLVFERKKVFTGLQYGFRAGPILLFTALVLNWVAGWSLQLVGGDVSLSMKILALVLFWLGVFILCYGGRAWRAGAFPLLFLLLTVPIPDVWLDTPITVVQYGSTEVCAWIFTLAGVPALRNGRVFYLSSIMIEVAKECSGIHSTLAIFIVSLIAGHLFLSSFWKKIALMLLALPVVCLTNGMRIAGLTLLAEYVNPRFLHGSLHHQGGMGFFVLALVLLFGILRILRYHGN